MVRLWISSLLAIYSASVNMIAGMKRKVIFDLLFFSWEAIWALLITVAYKNLF